MYLGTMLDLARSYTGIVGAKREKEVIRLVQIFKILPAILATLTTVTKQTLYVYVHEG